MIITDTPFEKGSNRMLTDSACTVFWGRARMYLFLYGHGHVRLSRNCACFEGLTLCCIFFGFCIICGDDIFCRNPAKCPAVYFA